MMNGRRVSGDADDIVNIKLQKVRIKLRFFSRNILFNFQKSKLFPLFKLIINTTSTKLF